MKANIYSGRESFEDVDIVPSVGRYVSGQELVFSRTNHGVTTEYHRGKILSAAVTFQDEDDRFLGADVVTTLGEHRICPKD